MSKTRKGMEKDLLHTTKFYSCSALKIALVSFMHARFHAITRHIRKIKFVFSYPVSLVEIINEFHWRRNFHF